MNASELDSCVITSFPIAKKISPCCGPKKTGFPFPGNPAVSFRRRPKVFRPQLALGVALSREMRLLGTSEL